MFIPAAVLARAAELADAGFNFSTVVTMLEREGNGTWPRRTLLRRVKSSSSSARGQNPTSTADVASRPRLLQQAVKTPAGWHAGAGGRDVCQECRHTIPNAGEPGDSLRTTDKRNRVVCWRCFTRRHGRAPSHGRTYS